MNEIRLKFNNPEGDKLSARLALPLYEQVQAYAIFAHCFTCHKNLNAVTQISKALTDNGFAVLRFDFIGLGQSEGDFADTNFSSNIDDLIAAADFLADEYEAPKLLVGHSLGGAAVLFAAERMPSIEAVATIGAPAGPGHVAHLFEDNIEEIKENGKAKVNIGGRNFTVKKQFLDDISDQNMEGLFERFRKPLLILHSPQDKVVEIDNAKKIYVNAHHPKSFVSLDGADHLLTNKADADYVGNIISNWASRYLNIKKEEKESRAQVDITLTGRGFTTAVHTGKHQLIADEPIAVGGGDLGPAPYDWLLSALGTCTAMTLRMYADRKKWPLQSVQVFLNQKQETITDEQGEKQKIFVINREIAIIGELDQDQRSRMIEIADRCPVHRTLHGEIRVHTRSV